MPSRTSESASDMPNCCAVAIAPATSNADAPHAHDHLDRKHKHRLGHVPHAFRHCFGWRHRHLRKRLDQASTSTSLSAPTDRPTHACSSSCVDDDLEHSHSAHDCDAKANSESAVSPTASSPSPLTDEHDEAQDQTKHFPSASSLNSVSASTSVSTTPISSHTHKSKGVLYRHDGSVAQCRFCEILRWGNEDFLYQDEHCSVFRPLYPISDSHILVVPRCHIRNITQLTAEHAALLRHMRAVAERVLFEDMDVDVDKDQDQEMSQDQGVENASPTEAGAEYTFAFHLPPFNSIDHVHMHAIRKDDLGLGCIAAIKFRTDTWWCRSYEAVLRRLDALTSASASSSPSS